MLGDRRPPDPLTATIDALAEHAADALATHVRRTRMWLRERNPLARLGLDIIQSTRHEIIQTRAYEALERIPAIRGGDWWLAPSVRCPGRGDSAHVVAADGRAVVIQARHDCSGGLEQADLSAHSLLALADDERLDVVAIVSVANDQIQPEWALAGSGRPIAVTPADRLAEIVVAELDGWGSYDPEAHPRLSRALYGARRCAQQRDTAITHLAGGLDTDRWLLAHGVRLPGLRWPIAVLAAGPTGIYVGEAEGIDPDRAATDAINAAGHLAQASRGMPAHVTPIVLGEPGREPHQLELGDGRRAWALPLDRAPTLIQQVDRTGVHNRGLRRLRKPAPGWQYRIAANDDGWTYEIRYDFSRHEAKTV